MNFREKLNELLEGKKIKDVAKDAKVSVSYLSMLANGRLSNTPSEDAIHRIEDALGVSENTLSIYAPTGSTTTFKKICSVSEDAFKMNKILAAVIKDRKLLDKLVEVAKKK